MSPDLRIQAALNGTRGAGDGAAVPLSPGDVVEAARGAVAAGAAELLVHPRTPCGRESLSPRVVGPLLEALRGAGVSVPLSVCASIAAEPDPAGRQARIRSWTVLPDRATVHFADPGAGALARTLLSRGVAVDAVLPWPPRDGGAPGQDVEELTRFLAGRTTDGAGPPAPSATGPSPNAPATPGGAARRTTPNGAGGGGGGVVRTAPNGAGATGAGTADTCADRARTPGAACGGTADTSPNCAGAGAGGGGSGRTAPNGAATDGASAPGVGTASPGTADAGTAGPGTAGPGPCGWVRVVVELAGVEPEAVGRLRRLVPGVPLLLVGRDGAAWPALRLAARCGTGARIGVGDVLHLPDGRPAPSTAVLVTAALAAARAETAARGGAGGPLVGPEGQAAPSGSRSPGYCWEVPRTRAARQDPKETT
ncbi:3-keto-5-aminohexanoate cleavage protein [Streptomyces sp. NPDC046876]|uniref:3-keto-5-aminohexanoate cleavage protein n=1 Tax=Streptomyces sp. NPDC046876 TaxID=3155616 RepID=UPI0033E4F8CB